MAPITHADRRSITARLDSQDERLLRIEAKLDNSLARKDGVSISQTSIVSGLVTAIGLLIRSFV